MNDNIIMENFVEKTTKREKKVIINKKYFLVDSENTTDFTFLSEVSKNDSVVIFHSLTSKSVSIEHMSKLKYFNTRYYKTTNGTKDAMDFNIVLYTGVLIGKGINPSNITIISDDNGFKASDDLIPQLRYKSVINYIQPNKFKLRKNAVEKVAITKTVNSSINSNTSSSDNTKKLLEAIKEESKKEVNANKVPASNNSYEYVYEGYINKLNSNFSEKERRFLDVKLFPIMKIDEINTVIPILNKLKTIKKDIFICNNHTLLKSLLFSIANRSQDKQNSVINIMKNQSMKDYTTSVRKMVTYYDAFGLEKFTLIKSKKDLAEVNIKSDFIVKTISMFKVLSFEAITNKSVRLVDFKVSS
ncbi:MAG: PIN domain-containing protein [Peptostreptococcaceae bacterium]